MDTKTPSFPPNENQWKELQQLLLSCQTSRDALEKRNSLLEKLNQFAIALSEMPLDNSQKQTLEAYIAHQLKEFSGAAVTTFSEYNPITKTMTARHVELPSWLLDQVVRLLGKTIQSVQIEISDDIRVMMENEIIGERSTLHEVSFGGVSSKVGSMIQSLLHLDRFMGVAYMVDGQLYGSSLLGFKKNQETVAPEILKQFMSIAALALKRNIAERAQQESEMRLKALHNASFGGIAIHDKGIILDCNQGLCEMSGYSLDELIGMNGLLLIAEHTREEVVKHIESGDEDPYEAVGIRKNGEHFPIRLEASNIPYKGKGVRSVEFRDISEYKEVESLLKERNEEIQSQNEEYKQLNEELFEAKEKAEESDRLKSAFLANMSHEIRTPMNGILGFAEVLSKFDLTGEEQKKYIRIIEKSGKRMLNIINDIIDISKIEAGQMDIDSSETNINEQMEELYQFFSPEVLAKNMTLSLSKGLLNEDALVFIDKEKLYAVLVNLLKNAIKYTKEGSIAVGYKKEYEKVTLDSEDDTAPNQVCLLFYVQDTGIGVPADQCALIFERFMQSDAVKHQAFQGAGLGLAISRAYVEMMGGTIWVESQEGKGSVFYFKLPYVPVKGQTPTVNKKEEQQHKTFTNLKVIIAEDDDISALLLETALRAYASEIIRVSNGNDAVEACRNNPDADIILMDIKMPGMNGDEAVRLIRQFNQDLVIIAQTAFALRGDEEPLLEAGCNAYITKPVRRDELLMLMNKYL